MGESRKKENVSGRVVIHIELKRENEINLVARTDVIICRED